MNFIPKNEDMLLRPYSDGVNIAFFETRKECKWKIGANVGEIYCSYDANTKDRYFFCLGVSGEEYGIHKKYSFCAIWKEK